MKQQMVLHCGGKPADLEDLRKVALPQETKSYKPLGHYPLVLTLGEVADKLLKDYEFDKGIYALSKDGQRMFGLHTYGTQTSDLSLAIGFRNSYDKSMSIGIAIGASVMICDNLALSGDITVMRKHTTNVIADLEMMILRVMYRAEENFTQICESADQMKQTELDDNGAFKMLGLLFGKNVLSPRQLPVAKKEWLSPSYSEFQPRNGWSFHNAVTAALKSTPPNKILERHIRLHDLVTENL